MFKYLAKIVICPMYESECCIGIMQEAIAYNTHTHTHLIIWIWLYNCLICWSLADFAYMPDWIASSFQAIKQNYLHWKAIGLMEFPIFSLIKFA